MEGWVGLVPDIFNSMARDLNFTFTLALSRLVAHEIPNMRNGTQKSANGWHQIHVFSPIS